MSVLTPGVAAANPFQSHPAAFKWTMFTNGFDSILRTSGGKSTIGTKHWGNGILIDSDQT